MTTTDGVSARKPAGRLLSLYRRIDDQIGEVAGALMLLAIRIYLFNIFFSSGLVKIGNFSGTVDLFGNDEWGYGPVSFLPPEIMAFIATAFELICPILLLAGLLTRLATLPLLTMAILIQFVLAASIRDFHNLEHFVWIAALGLLLRFGPGRLSIDAFLRSRA